METNDTDPMTARGAESAYLGVITLTTSALETLMEARTVTNLPPAAPHDDAVRCLLAIELSKKSWIVAVNTPLSDKISRYTLEACDWKGLLDLCERIRTRVAKEMKKPVEIISCYEAGYDGFWLHRVLEAHGIHNHVLDPASLQVNRRARRPKTDRIDADRMVRALIRHLRGEPEACSVVRVPSPEQEDARRLPWLGSWAGQSK